MTLALRLLPFTIARGAAAIAVTIASLVALPAHAEETPRTHATVLLYHKFDEPEHPTTNISSAQFREQLQYLADHDYNVLTLDAFLGHLEQRKPFPEKSVLITIDDPYRSAYQVAWPILKSFRFPFAFFVWTDGVERSFPDLVSWAQLEEMAAGGVAIANHTHTHPYLSVPQKDESRERYVARVSGEIGRAKALLQAHGVDGRAFAHPYGHYNNIIVEAARAAGYPYQFTQDPGGVDERTPPERIPRAALVGGEKAMKDFRYRLTLTPLRVSDIEPPYGFLEENPPGAFSLRILEPERFQVGVVNMFISELSRVDADYDARTGVLRFVPERPLRRNTFRMIVTAKDRTTGAFAMYSQFLVRPFDHIARGRR